MLGEEIVKLTIFFLIFNIVFSIFLFLWITDDDITNLPKEPLKRYMAILYFTVTTTTTTGYGDVVPKSVRARIVSIILQVSMFAIVAKGVLESEIKMKSLKNL
jgi:hypothetical protein